MSTLVDDVGSFPLPSFIDKKTFNRAYVIAREKITCGENIQADEFLMQNFYSVVVDSFKKKIEAEIDIVNYPQHYGIYEQFTDVIHKAMSKGTYIVDGNQAIIPEVHVISQEAKRLSEENGKRIALRVCITGPMELYLKEVGTTLYEDVLLMFAETVRRFAKNSIINSKYIKTEAVSLDEPSFGFKDISANTDTIIKVMEKAFDFDGATKHVHLHSSARLADVLKIKNLDVISFEYAASPRNIESLTKKMLENADKQVRIGIARTDIDAITAELYEKGITKPTIEQLVESEETIRKRYLKAKEKYGERMTFTGPDCGLGGWPSQEAAQLLLKRTAKATKSA